MPSATIVGSSAADALDRIDEVIDARQRRLELDDGREDLFREDVGPQHALLLDRHQLRDRVPLLEGGARRRERHRHALDVAEVHADRGPAELHDEPGLARLHAMGHVVGLHLFGAAAVDPGALVRGGHVRERTPDDARPDELVGLEGGGRTDVGLRIEAEPEPVEGGTNRADKRGVQVFLAHPAEALVALDARLGVDAGAMDGGINRDRPHRADRHAIAARDALVRVDTHRRLTSAVMQTLKSCPSCRGLHY